jgi:hypothetical protein
MRPPLSSSTFDKDKQSANGEVNKVFILIYNAKNYALKK